MRPNGCLECRRTFRVYSTAVFSAHQSDTPNTLSVLLHIWGLSYHGVSNLLESLDMVLGKATVDGNVQVAGQRAIRLRHARLAQQAGQIQLPGIEIAHVKWAGQDRIVAVATAILTGQSLIFDLLNGEGEVRLEQRVRDLARTIGAERADWRSNSL